MSNINIILKGIMIYCLFLIGPIIIDIIENGYEELFGWYSLLVSASAQSQSSKVTIIINDPPEPISKKVTTNEDESLLIKLEANDPDSINNNDDSSYLEYQIIDNPKYGDLSSDEITGNSFVDINYIPKPDFYGEDSFTFIVSDETDESENIGKITITVNPVNDTSSNEPPSPNEPTKPEEFGTILPAQSNVTETEKIKTDIGGDPIPYQHIIIFNEAYTENAQMADTTLQALSLIVESLGGEIIFTYNNTISGFTFKTTDQSKSDQILNILRLDPRVKFSEQDKTVVPFSQVIPSGIQRVGLDKVINGSGIDSSSIDVDIAIIDSGVDLDHQDLNVFNNTTTIIPQIMSSEDNTIRAKDIDLQKIGLNVENNTTSFYPPFSQESISTGDDNCGHGTHVAGIAAAKDNSFGVVGIAPGAKLWAIKVLDYDKNSEKCFGSISSVIAAIDYVTKYSDQIDVANLSLGCKCNSTALDYAITRSVAKNVTYVTASGNINTDASSFSPANHKDVLTVSAIADIDGKCGSLGTPIWVDAGNFSGFSNDDAFASFSNYGSVVDIAAPGVKINSTYINGTYALMGGTSIASPHVTGMVALYKSMNPMASPKEIKEILTNTGSYPNTVCDGLSYGYFDRDSDDDHEPLLHVFAINNVK